MRQWWTGLLTCLVVLGLGPGLIMGQEPKVRKGGKYALLIGVRKYAPDTLRNLAFTEADVTELAAVLQRSGYRREDITILTQTIGAENPGLLPTGKNIRAQLGIPDKPGQPFKRGLKLGGYEQDDTVLVAFAGHGVQFDAEGESYFCPMDADLTDVSTLLRLSDVSSALDGCKAGLKVLLVDACRNNPQILANRAGGRPVMDVVSLSRPFLKKPPGGTLSMFSCSPGEVAFEDDEVKHGIFFHHILRGLNGDAGLDGRGADSDGDGKVDANELAHFAEKNVHQHASRRYSREQTVEVVGRTRGGVAIIERRRDEKTVTNSIGMKLNLIPAGEFSRMGDGKTRHNVRITRPFYMGIYEVTQAEYKAVMGENPSSFSTEGKEKAKVAGVDTSRFPVGHVSWWDAVAFCKKLTELEGLRPGLASAGGTGYRIPTEAQWEYACRAGTKTPFAFGDRLTLDQANVAREPVGKVTVPVRPTAVGSYRPNAFGLFDMHGNLWEWCGDWHDPGYYSKSPEDDPPGPTHGQFRVFRGGGWNENAWGARSGARYSFPPDHRGGVGFRVIRLLPGD